MSATKWLRLIAQFELKPKGEKMMNVGQLIRSELQTIIADAENSPLAEQIKAQIETEIARVETEIKQYVDEVIAKAFQPSTPSQPTAPSGS